MQARNKIVTIFLSCFLFCVNTAYAQKESPSGDSSKNSKEKKSEKYTGAGTKKSILSEPKTEKHKAEQAALIRNNDKKKKEIRDKTRSDLKTLKNQVRPKK